LELMRKDYLYVNIHPCL